MKKFFNWLLTPLYAVIAIFVGRSDNRYVTPLERLLFYKRFMSKIGWYWKDQINHELSLYPIEVYEGLDVTVFKLIKWIRKKYPNVKDIKYRCGHLTIAKSTKIKLPRNIEASLMLFSEANGFGYYMNFEMIYVDAMVRYIGVCTNIDVDTGTFEWVLDGKSNENKIIEFVQKNANKGDVVELVISDFVSISCPENEHKPGYDSKRKTFIPFCRDNVDRDKLIDMLDEAYGEHQNIDGILPVIVWVA